MVNKFKLTGMVLEGDQGGLFEVTHLDHELKLAKRAFVKITDDAVVRKGIFDEEQNLVLSPNFTLVCNCAPILSDTSVVEEHDDVLLPVYEVSDFSVFEF